MGRFVNVQDNFSSGELAPLVQGRVNLDQYKSGVKEMFNFLPSKQGPAVRRPGTTHLGQVTHLNGLYDNPSATLEDVLDVHLIPFQLSATQSYLVAIVKLETRNVIQIYNYSPAFFSALFTSYTSQIIAESYYDDGGGYEGVIPYGQDIHKVQYAQNGNFLFIVHESGLVPPIVVTIKDPSGTPTFSVNHLYAAKNITGNTLADLSATDKVAVDVNSMLPVLWRPYTDINSNQITVAAGTAGLGAGSPTTLTATQAIFSAGMVKTYFKVTTGSTTCVYYVTSFSSSTVINVTVSAGQSHPGNANLWERQAWDDTYGHPKTLTFFEQRLCFGGNKKFPDTVWFSATGNFFLFMQKKLAQDLSTDGSGLNFFGAVSENDPFTLKPASDVANQIQWLTSTRSLYTGTLSTEYVLSGVNKAISPTNFQIRPETEIGSDYIQPLKINNSNLYVSKDGHQLYQFRYYDSNGSNLSKDMTLQFGGWESDYSISPSNLKIKQLSYNRSRSMAFALYKNAAVSFIKCILINDSSDVFGASTLSLGGVTREVLSMACLPNADTLRDNLVLAVKRTYASVDYFTIEEIHEDFDKASLTNYESAVIDTQTAFAPVYMDCARISVGVSSTSIVHPVLKSVNVDVLADGILYEDIALDASGNGTLPVSAVTKIFGLPFTSRITLLPMNLGAFGANDAIVSIKNIDKFWIQYRFSKHLEYGTEIGDLYSMEIDTALTDAILQSGVQSKSMPSSSDFLKSIIISTDKPFPATILQVGYRGVTEEV